MAKRKKRRYDEFQNLVVCRHCAELFRRYQYSPRYSAIAFLLACAVHDHDGLYRYNIEAALRFLTAMRAHHQKRLDSGKLDARKAVGPCECRVMACRRLIPD